MIGLLQDILEGPAGQQALYPALYPDRNETRHTGPDRVLQAM